MDKETLIIAWLTLLLAPVVIYGIWMRIKMMGSEEGQAFLVDREMAEFNAKHKNWSHSTKFAGKAAKLGVGIEAARGKYGEEIAAMVPKAMKFFLGYTLYAVIIGLAGYFLIF